MRIRYWLYILATVFLVAIVGCSGGGNPIAPVVDDNNPQEYRSPLLDSNITEADCAGHDVMLYCTFVLNLEDMTVDVVENHSAMGHYNVKQMLNDPFVCPNLNCIVVQLTGFDPVEKIYTVDVILRNPTFVLGYDVRGIMFLNPSKDTALLNPDNYIQLFDPLEQINPFKAFAKSAPDRQFPPASVYDEIYQVYIPPPPPLFNINYAVDVSWPGNCKEPYEIIDIDYNGNLTPSGGSGTISCRVNDHQDDVESVQVDLHGLTGGIEDMIYDPVEELWSLTFSNEMMQPIGDYTALIAAKSEDYNVKLYDYVDFAVVPGADQFISGRVFDCYTLSELDGAVVSTVNQDTMGYMPAPVIVADGEYEVPVDPGTYDMQISTAGYDIMVCNGIVVPSGENYEIDYGLNLEGDPGSIFDDTAYHYFSGGVTGKVTDADTGSPLPEAAVRVRSDQLNMFYSPQPKFAGGAHCKESGYYSATEVMASSDQYTYFPVGGWTVYCSAPGYEAVEVSVGYQVEANITVPNIHFQLNPIEDGKEIVFQEDFETSTGWTYELYDINYFHEWHIQTWNPGLINTFIAPGWVYLAPDEMDGGILPEPPLSPYNPGPNMNYLWYGDPADGNFIGDYDELSQYEGSGGNSLSEHGGYAVSPEIDLSGYSNGLLAFESWWEIESQNPPTFDFLEVLIRDDSGFEYPLDFLNPAVDPYMSADPISNGGHNRDGIWNHLVYDITPYMSNTSANITFRFYTRDSAYNGFKGWFIDNVYVYGY